MAAKKRRVVQLSEEAIAELAEIWTWNSNRYGPNHAQAYRKFLMKAIARLSHEWSISAPVDGGPKFRYRIARKRPGGHGHVLVFEVSDEVVYVLHVFHTAQDWRNQL